MTRTTSRPGPRPVDAAAGAVDRALNSLNDQTSWPCSLADFDAAAAELRASYAWYLRELDAEHPPVNPERTPR